MNPPYSCPGLWIAKLQEEFNCGRVEEAIALVPAATDTKWFHPLIASNLICFWKGRIKFLDTNYQPKMAARQSHCLIYWGKNKSRFRQIFSPYGNFNFFSQGETLEAIEERIFKIGDRF
ncbi:C-5 cytosine-specific DNA methylase [Nostoc sphaeroides CCNUC1]|uniref:C-5 cytosine-specific DNA methylase n=2 Tax=Nostoc sphaeroides TaxID=446679 RepID=A0A5P8WFM5_9NOSO|nr:C-5 cytosine-specific DNA methylase [Nostoc sphaeroides CCNUC1]